MSQFMTRGYAINTTLKYCREGISDPERRDRIVSALPRELIEWSGTIKPTEWYPAERISQILDVVAAASDGDATIAEHDLIGNGKFAGQEATNTFLRLLMKVLTPSLFAKKLPSLYKRDNSRGEVEVDVRDDRLVLRMREGKGFRHLAPMTAGWVIFALGAMGKTLDKSSISDWSVGNPDPDEFTVDISWKA